MKRVAILSAQRTPIGGFLGSLSSCSAPQLAQVAIKQAVEKSGIDKKLIQSAFFGNVLSAGIGQASAPARNVRFLCSHQSK